MQVAKYIQLCRFHRAIFASPKRPLSAAKRSRLSEDYELRTLQLCQQIRKCLEIIENEAGKAWSFLKEFFFFKVVFDGFCWVLGFEMALNFGLVFV